MGSVELNIILIPGAVLPAPACTKGSWKSGCWDGHLCTPRAQRRGLLKWWWALSLAETLEGQRKPSRELEISPWVYPIFPILKGSTAPSPWDGTMFSSSIQLPRDAIGKQLNLVFPQWSVFQEIEPSGLVEPLENKSSPTFSF